MAPPDVVPATEHKQLLLKGPDSITALLAPSSAVSSRSPLSGCPVAAADRALGPRALGFMTILGNAGRHHAYLAAGVEDAADLLGRARRCLLAQPAGLLEELGLLSGEAPIGVCSAGSGFTRTSRGGLQASEPPFGRCLHRAVVAHQDLPAENEVPESPEVGHTGRPAPGCAPRRIFKIATIAATAWLGTSRSRAPGGAELG